LVSRQGIEHRGQSQKTEAGRVHKEPPNKADPLAHPGPAGQAEVKDRKQDPLDGKECSPQEVIARHLRPKKYPERQNKIKGFFHGSVSTLSGDRPPVVWRASLRP